MHCRRCHHLKAQSQFFQQQNHQKGAAAELKSKYDIEPHCLGTGSFGKVFLASAVADKDFEVAIKAIPKKKIPDLSQIRQEVSTLQTLDHPNIIKYYETYENQQFIYVVMEYCPGGELFDVIAATAEKSGTFDENEARRIMGALLQAVNHCHANKIAHRDIKPENIMIGENNVF